MMGANSLPMSLARLHDQFILIVLHVVEQNLLESEKYMTDVITRCNNQQAQEEYENLHDDVVSIPPPQHTHEYTIDNQI
jgi:hypothetical protein